MLKKTVVLVLCLFMLLVFGCTPKVVSENEPFTFSILYNDKDEIPYQSDWLIASEYKKTKDVTLDVHLGDDKDYETAISLNINAEDPPDVILKCWPDTIESYANDGLILPISDYFHMMPYFSAYIKENNLQDEVDKLYASNGKCYLLPGFERKIQVQQWAYRKDVFEDNDIALPATYDELFDALVQLKSIYPNSTPITASWGGAHLFSMMGAGYGIPAGWSGTRYYDEMNDQWLYAPATNNYQAMHRYLNRCYMAGILDPATFDQSNEDFLGKVTNGKALVTVTTVRSGFGVVNQQLKDNGVQQGVWDAMPVMESTMGISALPPVGRYRVGLVVHANAKDKPYFEDLIRFLDWAVYSEEGMTLSSWGIEGVTYENVDQHKQFLSHIQTPLNPSGSSNIKKEYGMGMFFELNENKEYEDNKRPQEIVAFLQRSETAQEALPLPPKLILNSNEIKTIGIINENLDMFVSEASYQFIVGERNIENEWNEYIQELDDRGYTILEQVWNDAWMRQNQ